MEIKIFISYSHEDRSYLKKNSLLGFLKGLVREGVCFWTDENLVTGEFWDEKIKIKIKETDIVLVLVSQAFLNSNYCANVEISGFLNECRNRGLIIFPIILSACEWQRYEWLKSRQFLPRDGKTIEKHYKDDGDRKELFLKILQDLRTQIDEVRKKKRIKLDIDGMLKEASYAPTICSSPDGYWLATLHANKTVHLWAMNDLSKHIAITPQNTDDYFTASAMRQTSKGWELLIGLSQGFERWHIEADGTYNLIEFFMCPNLVHVQYSTDGILLLAVTLEGVLSIRQVSNGEILQHFDCQERLTMGSFCDNNRYVIAGSESGKTFLWERSIEKLISVRDDHHKSRVSSLIGFASSPIYISTGEDGSLVSCQCRVGQLLNSFSFEKNISCAIYNETKKQIGLCLKDGTFIVHDVLLPKIYFKESISSDPVSMALIGKNFLAIADYDRKIVIYDTGTNKRLYTLIGFGGDDWLKMLEDGDLTGKGYERFILKENTISNSIKKPIRLVNLSEREALDQLVIRDVLNQEIADIIKVLAGKKTQETQSIVAASIRPLILLIDKSGSMQPNINMMIDAQYQLISSLLGACSTLEIYLGQIHFNHEIEYFQKLCPIYNPDNPHQINPNIKLLDNSNYIPEGGSVLHDAIVYAIAMLMPILVGAEELGQQVFAHIAIITDGVDRQSKTKAEDLKKVIDFVLETGVIHRISLFGLGDFDYKTMGRSIGIEHIIEGKAHLKEIRKAMDMISSHVIKD